MLGRKGTGYYYSRYRPGLGLVLGFVLLVISGFHYLGMVISARSHRSRIQGHIDDARTAAGYPNLNKRKRVTTESGRAFQVDPSGDVYLCVAGPGNQEVLLDVDQVPAASFQRSLLVRVPQILYRTTVGRLISSSIPLDGSQDPLDDAESSTPTTKANGVVAGAGKQGKRNKKQQ